MEIQKIHCKNATLTIEETDEQLIVRDRESGRKLFAYEFDSQIED